MVQITYWLDQGPSEKKSGTGRENQGPSKKSLESDGLAVRKKLNPSLGRMTPNFCSLYKLVAGDFILT